MDSKELLTQLLADFVFLQYKFHSIHTDMCCSPIWIPIHTIMNDIYQMFGDDQIDWIKERVRILGGFTPASLNELSKMTNIDEITSVPAMSQILNIVAKDLRYMESVFDHIIKATNDDLVTQNKIIDRNDAVGKFRWKIEMSIPQETSLPTKEKK